MPFLKQSKKREPLWREADAKAQKEGLRAPVYAVSGNVYTGQWVNNKKQGHHCILAILIFSRVSAVTTKEIRLNIIHTGTYTCHMHVRACVHAFTYM